MGIEYSPLFDALVLMSLIVFYAPCIELVQKRYKTGDGTKIPKFLVWIRNIFKILGVLHLARDGSEVPISSQFGGVLRTKNQLYFGEKEDVNKNISGRFFLKMLKECN